MANNILFKNDPRLTARARQDAKMAKDADVTAPDFTPTAWQRDPMNVKTERVQFWSAAGTMLTAQMSNEAARQMVSTGRAYVITDQAIGQMHD